MLFPSSKDQGVVINAASLLCSRISLTASSTFDSFTVSVCESIIDDAFSIWSLKNSPKFFIYILHFPLSTTVAKQLITASFDVTSLTARITSESLPTPEGSIIILSG